MLALGLVAFALAGCTGGDDAGGGGDGDDATTVKMKNTAYSSKSITVEVGATVTWVNEDPYGHTVTPEDKAQWGTDGSGDAASEWIQQGQSWSFTFTAPGDYYYYCVPHASPGGAGGHYQGMVGIVHVA